MGRPLDHAPVGAGSEFGGGTQAIFRRQAPKSCVAPDSSTCPGIDESNVTGIPHQYVDVNNCNETTNKYGCGDCANTPGRFTQECAELFGKDMRELNKAGDGIDFTELFFVSGNCNQNQSSYLCQAQVRGRAADLFVFLKVWFAPPFTSFGCTTKNKEKPRCFVGTSASRLSLRSLPNFQRARHCTRLLKRPRPSATAAAHRPCSFHCQSPGPLSAQFLTFWDFKKRMRLCK
jgi:hypothetical protein